jgi:carboxymethylenebutenolidase
LPERVSTVFNMSTERVELDVGDGPPMGAYLARPDGAGPFPGVVVAMELFGVTAHVREVCDRLAGQGYLALAPDLYHRTAPDAELAEDGPGRERGFEQLNQMSRPQALADVRAAIEFLRAQGSGSVGIVGLSVGGHVAYLAASEFDLAAVVVVYGGWIPTTDIPLSRPEPTLSLTPGITGEVLVLVGEDDHVVPPEQRSAIAGALEEAGVRHALVEYPGVGHGFLSERRESFDEAAAQDAWDRIDRLLAERLG